MLDSLAMSIPEAASELGLSGDTPGLRCPKGQVEVRTRGRIGGSSGPTTIVSIDLEAEQNGLVL